MYIHEYEAEFGKVLQRTSHESRERLFELIIDEFSKLLLHRPTVRC